MAAAACADAVGLPGADWDLVDDDAAALLVPYPPLVPFDMH
jgi:hypothetical protein